MSDADYRLVTRFEAEDVETEEVYWVDEYSNGSRGYFRCNDRYISVIEGRPGYFEMDIIDRRAERTVTLHRLDA